MLKTKKERKKPNCKNDNIACGKKCQPRHYKCPSEKSTEVSKASDKFVDNILVAETISSKISTTKPSAEEYYNSSLALFSKESKAERRAKIKGLSNEKELKKIQLKEENEAWIFVRLKRELDRLVKSGEKTEEISKLKDLLSRIIDGDEEAKAEGKERVEGKVKVSKKLSVETATKLDALDTTESEAVEKLKKFGIRLFRAEEIKTNAELIVNVEQRLEKIRAISSSEASILRMTNNLDNLLSDVIKYSDESKTKTKEVLDLLNEALEKSFDENKSFNEILKEKREVLYALKGDMVRSPIAAGDASIRNKVSIPPVPSKFINNGESNNEPIDETFRNFLEEAKVLVQVTPAAFIGILDSGEIKNTFAEGLNEDLAYLSVRKKIEEKILGVSYDEKNPKNRPIYGYVESPRHINSAEITQNTGGYGAIKLVLKDEVKTRSTITLTDSFWSESATPMLRPTTEFLGGLGDKKIVSIRHEGGGTADLKVVDDQNNEYDRARLGYLEAQIFGGVKLDDIEFVSIPSFFFEKNPEIYNILVSLGIPFEVVN